MEVCRSKLWWPGYAANKEREREVGVLICFERASSVHA